MGEPVDRVRGAGSVVDYMNLLLCLLYLRGAGGPRWEGVAYRARNGRGSDGAAALLSHIGTATDELLKGLGAVPGMRETLLGLEPRTYGDLKGVVDQVEDLDRSAFRLVLDEYEMRAGLRSTEFFTPRAVARIMVRIVRTECHGKAPGRVYDPYARGGELLAEAVAECATGGDVSALDVRGYSHGRDAMRLASMNLALQGVRPGVVLGRSTPWAPHRGRHDAERFDLVLTNPPFNMSDSAGEPRAQGAWLYGPPPIGNDNFAYVQHVLESLDEDGAAAVVMPNKASNSANEAEVKIRRAMVERGVVRCVTALPDRLFSSTPVPVSVWILVSPTRPCEEVLFLDARALGSRRNGKRVLVDEDVEAVLTAYRSALPPQAGAHAGLPRDTGVLSAVVPRAVLLRTMDHSLSPTDHVHAGQPRQEDAESAFEKAAHEVEARRRELLGADSAAALGGIELECPTPAERREVRLSELCRIKAGPSYSLLRAEQRKPDGGVPLVFPKDLDNGRIQGPGIRRVPWELAERLRGFQLQAGDIVCVRSGAIGQPALVRPEQSGWLMSTNLLRLRLCEEARVDPEYLLACLSRPGAVAWVRDRATATGAPSISATALGNQQVVLLPHGEQQRIARALAALEAQVSAHLRFADAVRDARAALVEHLVNSR
jgi:type I restriction enzyme M protein